MGARTRRGNRAEGLSRHTRPMRTARLFVTLAFCAAVAAGCGPSSSAARNVSHLSDAHPSVAPPRMPAPPVAPAVTSTTATTTVSGITAEYNGPITQDDSDASTGISLTVPPTDAEPTLSWQRAVALCFSGAGICNRAAGTIRVSLAVGYDPQSGDLLPDGSIEPVMNHNLLYVLAQSVGPCAHPGPPGASTRPSTYPSCMSLSFVDAHTGKGATAVSGPSIRDPGAA
jgi:hypothetical protein